MSIIHASTHRPRRARRVRLDHTADAQRAAELARAVDAVFAEDPDHPPTLVAALTRGDEVELHLEPLAHHPAIELEGMVAPTTWWCLGIVAGGTARPLADAPGPSATAGARRVHVVHLVTRSGSVARVLRDLATGERDEHTEAGGRPAPEQDLGLLDDYLRRALLVPTPPPAHPTTDLWAALWIHHVMNDAVVHRLLDAPWSRVAGLHPALHGTVDQGDRELQAWATEHLVRAGEIMATAYPWGRVREACTHGIGPVTGRPAELAGWLDDGSFARLVMGSFGPIEDLVADLRDLLRPDVHQRVLDTVAAWGLADSGPGASP